MTITELVVTLIVAILGSNGIATVITILINRHYQKEDEKKSDQAILRKAIEAVAHDSYLRHCRYLLSKDTITEAEAENHEYLYSAYHSLGMNGTGDKMHQQITAMKVAPDQTEWHTVLTKPPSSGGS